MIVNETYAYFRGARRAQTPSGEISYVELGSGPVALFVHGVLMNGYLWRHQLQGLADVRRCIALDLLAHGLTDIAPTQDVSVTANARMIAQFLDALNIDKVDLVGNDSGGGICQIFAALYPERVSSLTLTNCDTHDNWPPEAFKPFVKMVAAGGLAGTLSAMLHDKSIYRSPEGLGLAYERPEALTDGAIDGYLGLCLRTEQRTRDLERFIMAFDNAHTVAIESRLRAVQVPALIVWGDDDVFFDVRWSEWLEEALKGTKRRVVLKGARIFFPEERADEFNKELRKFWTTMTAMGSIHAPQTATVTVYEIVEQCIQSVKGFERCLDKAEQHAAARQMDVGDLLAARLAPDQRELIYQIQSACDYLKAGAAWLSGQTPPKHEDNERTIEELRARIRKTVAFAESIAEVRYADAGASIIRVSWVPGKVIGGVAYLLQLTIPNVYFHLAMAYAILRHEGVDVGKMDFLGTMSFVEQQE